MIVDPQVFLAHGSMFTNRTANYHLRKATVEFRNVVGVGPSVCSALWKDLGDYGLVSAKDAEPVHLLWALVFLRQYPTERFMAGVLKRSRQTIRKYVMYIVRAILAVGEHRVS